MWISYNNIYEDGPYGEFLGCSNYGSAGCTYKRPAEKTENGA